MYASTNYIYIIFAVIYVIYSIIKAGKKVTNNRPTIDQQPNSQPTVQPPTATSPPQQDFKKMLEDLLGGVPVRQEERPPTVSGEEKIPTSHPKPQPVKISIHHKPKKETATASQDKPFPAKPHKVSHSQHYEAAKKVFEEPVVVEEAADSLRDGFDIREAVIYSEILKRPDW
jgi:hypothetical protein